MKLMQPGQTFVMAVSPANRVGLTQECNKNALLATEWVRVIMLACSAMFLLWPRLPLNDRVLQGNIF